MSNSTHDKWYTLSASTVPYSLVLTKQPRLYFMNTTLPLYQLEKQAANATLRWFLCPAKQKVSFVSRSTKRCRWEKCFLCIHYFSKMKSNPAKKTTEQYFSGKTKPTCQNSAIFEHFLAHGLSIIIWPIGHHNIKRNILKICLLCFFFFIAPYQKAWLKHKKDHPDIVRHTCLFCFWNVVILLLLFLWARRFDVQLWITEWSNKVTTAL